MEYRAVEENFTHDNEKDGKPLCDVINAEEKLAIVLSYISTYITEQLKSDQLKGEYLYPRN